MGREMMGYGTVAGGVEEFDEEFVRGKLKELLEKALFPRGNYRGLKATHEQVARELAEIKANYAQYGEAYVEYVGRLGEGEEKAFREAEKAMREALKRVDELKIKRTGKTRWKAKLSGAKWRLYVHLKQSGYWSVEVRLYIRVAKLRLPDTLRIPPELLRVAQEGWVLGDASYDADRGEVKMSTSQSWQVASFPGFWPEKDVTICVKSVVINETRVSVTWYVVVKGVRDAPRLWSLPKVVKQRIILKEIGGANEGKVDIVRALKLALLYAADGEYPGPNSAKHVLEFAVGRRSRQVRTGGSVRIARLLYKEVPQLLAYMVASGCKKAEFLASLAFVEPRPYRLSLRYLEVAGVRMNLQLVGNKNYYTLAARVYITEDNEEMLRDFPERARKEGLVVKKMKIAKKYYCYYAGMRELTGYCDKHPEAYNTLIDFVQEELETMPLDHPARRSVERLLERLRKARERALKKLGARQE
ncbi:hypothetical protein [Thermofilum pendens]|uniref:Uncharacterized protein n=1 Tax=Thermofilum pendens (strain DSM 2475 / Hrk 5) TaxID=368408 RepID=A1RXN5_THEPD|nr:hypothetical protein [Thermofilum pendens]ABL77965.1 hypothetical protein Tpen_0559 [Thermofilum pendens Hrk 5]